MTETTRKRILLTAITLTVFIVADNSRDMVFHFQGYANFVADLPTVLRWLEQPLRWVVLCIIGLVVAHRIAPWRAFRELGLIAPVGAGLVFGLIVTLPMTIPSVLMGSFASDLKPIELLFFAGIWPLAEEILFRGYAFRQLHRRAGWNLWLAAAITGLAFGLGHLANASIQNLPLDHIWGTVALMSVGAFLLGWVFAAWNDNLWIPIFVHSLMNLWWIVFDLSDNPAGNLAANAMRIATIVLVVILTLNRKRMIRLFERMHLMRPPKRKVPEDVD